MASCGRCLAMASMSPVSATTVVYFFRDSSNVIVFSCDPVQQLGLFTLARISQRANFNFKDFRESAAMPLRAAEFRTEEVFHAVRCNRDTHGAASQAEYIHVVVLDPLARGVVIVTKSGAHSDNFY